MSQQQKLLALFGGVCALLLLATLVGRGLRRRAASPEGRAVVENLEARVRAWWVMVGIFAACFLVGPAATLVLFALTSFYTLPTRCASSSRSRRPARPTPGRWPPPSTCCFRCNTGSSGPRGTGSSPSWCRCTASCCCRPWPRCEATRATSCCASRIQWGLMLTVYCISHAPALLILDIPGFEGQGFLLLFFLITVVQFSDVMQYVFGKLMGRRPIAPRVSPSKTWEGFVGGGLSATALGAGLWWITPFAPWQAGAVAALIVAAGFLGGLALSAVKRSMGAKDWGAMVKGHGGVLDRMDSVSFSAPLFFHATRYFFAV